MKHFAFILMFASQATMADGLRLPIVRPGDARCLEPAVEFLSSVFTLDPEARVFVQRDAKKIPIRIDYGKKTEVFQYALKRIYKVARDSEMIEFHGGSALIRIEGTIQRDGKCKVTNRQFKSAHNQKN